MVGTMSAVALLNVPVSAAGTVTGQVYIDYNANGTMDDNGQQTDTPLRGVGVELYDINGVMVDTTTTGFDGNYTVTADEDGPYRIEFVDVPSEYSAAPVGQMNNSSVQFVNDGDTANYAVVDSENYCENNGFLTTSCYLAGNVEGDTLVRFPYGYTTDLDGSITGENTAGPDFVSRDDTLMPTPIGFNNTIGTVYGLAYDRGSETIYSGAYVRRKAKLGALSGESTGAIYVTKDVFGTATSEVFADLNAIYGSNVAGENPHPAATTNFDDDNEMREFVGRTGLGDVELSQDGLTLYTVNLADKQLYALPIEETPTADNIATYPVPSVENCPDVDVQPFATGVDDNGTVYLGAVCSGASMFDDSMIRGYVWTLGEDGEFDQVLDVDLNEVRGGDPEYHGWNYWQVASDNLQQTQFPQPMLTDIEFENGNLILGIRDRYGDQTPGAFLRPDQDPWPRGYGDILKATPSGDGFEVTSEFYPLEVPGGYSVDEATSGALAVVEGGDLVATTAFDAVNQDSNGNEVTTNWNTGGIQLYDNNDGSQVGAYDVYLASYQDTMGKTNGLGDLEYICQNVPVEIGNFVWIDTDRDGEQDANEQALAGVEIALRTGGETIAFATTDANGNYLFSTVDGETTASAAYGLNLDRDTEYEVVINAAQTALDGYEPTGADLAQENRDSDGIAAGNEIVAVVTPSETDHTIDFGFVEPAFFGGPAPTGTIGTLVFTDVDQDGFFDDSVDTRLNGVTVELFIDSDDDCEIDDTFAAPFQTTVTDSNGEYLFTGLPLDTGYIVRVNGEDVDLDTATSGLLDTDNHSQDATGYCVRLTVDQPDINYADFGFSVPGAFGGANPEIPAPEVEDEDEEETPVSFGGPAPALIRTGGSDY